MNRIIQVLLTLVIFGVATTGMALAGNVDAGDVNFIQSTGAPTVSAGDDVDAWASVGVVSRSDHDFISRDATVAAAMTAAAEPVGAVGTVDGADYRLIAGDGSPGATCQIALVAAIHPSC
ncbi:MAG: hypothetical protein RBR20_03960 [Desulfobacterales bacterium]|jgi:hypothetical protein|nr:hypothetical protein [Desulfobacteraceae bacterium]MDD3991372.1 hypothetical protein [Desulfobacteraceae bacterium]MDY0311259.1 hypothetical protein [Desulfobacterales bacterium]